MSDLESTKVPNTGPIWDQIAADFQAAANALPDTQSEKGRATSWAAKAFLAKTYMYQGASKYSQAQPILKDIVDNGPFTLTDKYEDNYLVLTRNNSDLSLKSNMRFQVEMMRLQIKVLLWHIHIYLLGDVVGSIKHHKILSIFFQTDASGLPLLDESWKTNHITNPTGDDIGKPIGNPSVDPRLDHTVGRPGILYKNHHIMQVDYIRDLTYAGPYFSKKHVAEPEGIGISGWGHLSANNYRIMRLGHVMLWLAETYVESGNLEEARMLVNKIRVRAANPNGFVPEAIQGATRVEFTTTSNPAANYNIGEYTSVWTDSETARKAVRYETRLETAMEGHRFFDLQRWGIMNEVLSDYLSRESQYRVYLQGKSFSYPKNEYYPIPSNAIDRSFKDGEPTLTQDPNY